MTIKTDIIQSISAELRAEVLKCGAGLFRLERGTLMLRHPETLDTAFFADEADAIGQLLHGLPAKRRRP
jgi:hypothetical protein